MQQVEEGTALQPLGHRPEEEHRDRREHQVVDEALHQRHPVEGVRRSPARNASRSASTRATRASTITALAARREQLHLAAARLGVLEPAVDLGDGRGQLGGRRCRAAGPGSGPGCGPRAGRPCRRRTPPPAGVAARAHARHARAHRAGWGVNDLSAALRPGPGGLVRRDVRRPSLRRHPDACTATAARVDLRRGARRERPGQRQPLPRRREDLLQPCEMPAAKVLAFLEGSSLAQRAVRDSSAATAATPAVEVRSTGSPIRTTCAAPNAASSSSVIPPSGPTTTTIEATPSSGSEPTAARSPPRAARRPGRQPRPARPPRRSSPSRSPRAATTAATACPTRGRWRATSPATSPPARRARRPTQRAAAQGTIRSTPISVSTSTASSARSPLGIACTTVTDGVGGAAHGDRARPSAPACDLVVAGDRAGRRRPRPSTSTTCSPTRIRRTTTACRASSPSTTTVVADGDAGHRAEEDRQAHAVTRSARVEGVAEPAEAPTCAAVWIWPSGDSSWRSSASSRSSSSWRSSRRAGRLHVDGDDHVAAHLRAQVRYAAAAQRLLGAGLGAGPDLEVDPQLHVGVGLGDVGLEQRQLDRRTERGRGHRHARRGSAGRCRRG